MLDYIFIAVFGLIGLAGFIGFFIKLKSLLKTASYGGRTNAEVAGVKEELVKVGKDETETYYSPIVTYRVGGVLYRKTFAAISTTVKPEKGSQIRIRYDLKDPSNFSKENMSELALQTFGLLFVGVGMVIFISNVLL